MKWWTSGLKTVKLKEQQSIENTLISLVHYNSLWAFTFKNYHSTEFLLRTNK